jgi:hypothetical protein
MKDLRDRVQECIRLREQLFEFGLLAPQQMIDDMNVFVRDGTPATGKVFLPRAGRVLEYVLSTKHPCSAVLKK